MLYSIDKRFGELFKDLYSPMIFPDLFLRPESMSEMTAQGFYHLLWTPELQSYGTVTFDDIVSFLKKRIKRINVQKIFLLGSHKKARESETELSMESAGELAAQLSKRTSSALYKRILKEGYLRPKAERVLKKALLEAMQPVPVRRTRNFPVQSAKRSVIPAKISSKRDIFLLSCGIWPVFFRARPNVRIYGEVTLYIDVSQSVRNIIHHIYNAVQHFENYLGTSIYLFSEKVVEITKRQLLKNELYTTGGTSFNCVAEHIIDNKIKKAVLITDGKAEIDRELQEKIRWDMELITVLTEDNVWSPVWFMSRKIYILPEGSFEQK